LFRHPTSGTYILNGQDGQKDDELAEIRNKEIGFCFSNFNLLPCTTALANVVFTMIYAGYSSGATKTHKDN
jgi:putative ABC transport system ATP-binding protein